MNMLQSVSNNKYKRAAEELYQLCQEVQLENERFVHRINKVKKLVQRRARDNVILKRRLDRHNDNWRSVPMVAPHPKRKIEQKRGPKPKNKNPQDGTSAAKPTAAKPRAPRQPRQKVLKPPKEKLPKELKPAKQRAPRQPRQKVLKLPKEKLVKEEQSVIFKEPKPKPAPRAAKPKVVRVPRVSKERVPRKPRAKNNILTSMAPLTLPVQIQHQQMQMLVNKKLAYGKDQLPPFPSPLLNK